MCFMLFDRLYVRVCILGVPRVGNLGGQARFTLTTIKTFISC